MSKKKPKRRIKAAICAKRCKGQKLRAYRACVRKCAGSFSLYPRAKRRRK